MTVVGARGSCLREGGAKEAAGAPSREVWGVPYGPRKRLEEHAHVCRVASPVLATNDRLSSGLRRAWGSRHALAQNCDNFQAFSRGTRRRAPGLEADRQRSVATAFGQAIPFAVPWPELMPRPRRSPASPTTRGSWRARHRAGGPRSDRGTSASFSRARPGGRPPICRVAYFSLEFRLDYSLRTLIPGGPPRDTFAGDHLES